MSTTGVDPRNREYLSPFSTAGFGLSLMAEGAPSDADGNVTATLINEDTGDVVFTQVAAHPATGQYTVPTTPAQTSVSGLYTVNWDYSMHSTPQEYQTYFSIGQSSPAYDSLSSAMKDIVETTMARFADTYDSPGGGPNLQTYFQTHYDRGRIAQLLRIAVGTLNTVSQPYQTYTVDGIGGGIFPLHQWGPLLERSLYIEVLKHLIRSYVEQPMINSGENLTRLDRRDYMDRWRMVLQDEVQAFEKQLDSFKISNMGLGSPSVLVSGGVFGRYAPNRAAGSLAARPRMWTRFYAVLLIAGGAYGAVQSHAWQTTQSPTGTSAVSAPMPQRTTSGRVLTGL